MQDDPILLIDVRAWLTKAMNDLRGVDVDLAAKPPLLEDALFHCQQVVEKSFKAFLTYHNEPFRRTHSLEETGEACLRYDATLKPLVDEAVPLSQYAWMYRYPGHPAVPSVEEVLLARDCAQRVYQAILDRLPARVHPEP
jgi:HEPN domain-containing protein